MGQQVMLSNETHVTIAMSSASAFGEQGSPAIEGRVGRPVDLSGTKQISGSPEQELRERPDLVPTAR